MRAYGIALFVHFLGLIALFGAFVIYARAGMRLRAAGTLEQARMWGPHRHRGSTHRPEMPAPQTRRVGLAAQAFALLGTLVGVFTIAIGVGPRSGPDIAYHVAIAAALVWGLVVAKRAPDDQAGQHT